MRSGLLGIASLVLVAYGTPLPERQNNTQDAAPGSAVQGQRGCIDDCIQQSDLSQDSSVNLTFVQGNHELEKRRALPPSDSHENSWHNVFNMTQYFSSISKLNESIVELVESFGERPQDYVYYAKAPTKAYGLGSFLNSSYRDPGWQEAVRESNGTLPPVFTMIQGDTELKIQGPGDAANVQSKFDAEFSFPLIDGPPVSVGWVYFPGIIPVTPTIDPFYRPSDYVTHALGNVLAWRPVGGIPSVVGLSRAFQLVFRTETATHTADTSVTTVMAPAINNNIVVLNYLTYEDARQIHCSPSYSMLAGWTDPVIVQALWKGFVVNLVDYEGQQGLFGVNVANGRTTLNAMRAYNNFAEQLLIKIPNRRHVVYGISGGAGPALYVAEEHGNYARDVNVAAVAAGGWINDAAVTLRAVEGTSFAGLAPNIISSYMDQFADVRAAFTRMFKGNAQAHLNDYKSYCVDAALIIGGGANILGGYFKNGANVLNDVTVKNAFAANTLGKKVNQLPLYLFSGTLDNVSPYGAAQALVNGYCRLGGHVQFSLIAGQDHVSIVNADENHSLNFVENVALHGYDPGPCKDWAAAERHTT